jgi:protein involved in polysaccharide export with SLBB domain
MGAFQKPGIYALQSGQTNLLELLSAVGGLQANTTRRIKVTRRLEQGRIPLANAIDDPDSKTSSVEISLNRLMESPNPAENVTLEPYDVLHASRAEMVFVSGEVGKTGGYPLEERESLSVIQLLTLAGGLSKDADAGRARILRPILDTTRRAEIPLNVKRIMAGQENDYPLMANDILIVPRGKSKAIVTRPIFTLVPALLTSLVWVALR